MNYFKNTNNDIFAYDDEQVKQGYSKDLTAITEAEKEAIVNPPKTESELLEIAKAELLKQINEAYKYLSDTDYCFTVDKYTQLAEDRKLELETKRQEARDLINSLEANNE